MTNVHPSAVLEGEVDLGPDVTIGPGCVLTGPVTVGARTRLVGHVWINGPVTIGADNVLYPNCAIGFAPQSVSYDHATAGCGVRIGSRNVLREGVTIHRAMTDEGPTTLGDRNYFMVNSHAGHDAQVGHGCILSNGALLGGHAVLQDRVVMGGNAGVHQFTRVGEGAMLSGNVGNTLDLPPWFMLTGTNIVGSINLIGLRRAGIDRADIDDARWAYRVIARSGLSMPAMLEQLDERSDRPMIQTYIDFVRSATRGVCTGRGRPPAGRRLRDRDSSGAVHFAAMTISFTVLGSGSRGNASLLNVGGRRILIDCGLSPRATGRRLEAFGIELASIDDIVLTHADRDHFSPGWIKPVEQHGIMVHVHVRHRRRIVRDGLSGRNLQLFEDAFTLDGGVHVDPVRLAHDQLGSVGLVIEAGGTRLGWATDLGRVGRTLLDHFVDLDALAIESNYDRRMQMRSGRPDFLVRRIVGGAGHLSNEESLRAVRTIEQSSPLRRIVALHLSQECNAPRILRTLYESEAPDLLDRLTISAQDEPTPMIEVIGGRATGAQMQLFARA